MKQTIVLLLFVFCSGCASVGVTKMRQESAKAPTCELDVYSSESEIKKPFEVVCLIDAKTGSSAFADKTVAGAVNLTRKEACKCGADAIVVNNGRSEKADFFGYGAGFAVVKAIKYSKP